MDGQISLFDLGIEKESRWIIDIDNETQMLRCESCGCRVIRQWYDRAVGNNGFNNCPYCGKKMSNKAQMIVPWPGYQEPEHSGKWIPLKRGETGYSVSDFRCSVCGMPCRCYSLTDFCPECGTYMNEGKRIPERGV